MIDTNELRVSAANSVRDLALLPSEVLELLNRLEAAEKERDWHAERCEDAMNECDALRAQIEQMEIGKREISEARDALQVEVGKLKDLEVSRCVKINGYIVDNARLAEEVERLQAEIAEMERQAPTHWSCNVLQADASWKEEVGREIPPDGYYSIRDIKPLYTLPGAKTQGEGK